MNAPHDEEPDPRSAPPSPPTGKQRSAPGEISDDDLKERVDAHEAWVNSAGKDGARADLRGSVLSRVDLRARNLQRADLHAADLRDACLADANFQGADLGSADLRRAVLCGADLRGADVSAARFGMTVLTGAMLPESLNEFRETITEVAETSKTAQTIHFSIIFLCAFALLTAATTTDAQLILDTIRLRLPILDVEVPVIAFYVTAPLFGLLVFIYLHMHLTHLWELAADLPAVFPDGLPVRRKLYPWMLNIVIEVWQNESHARARRRARLQRSPLTRLSGLRPITAILLGWGLLPATVVLLAYRLLARNDAIVSSIVLAIVVSSVLISSVAYEQARATVAGHATGHWWKRSAKLVAATLLAGGGITLLGLRGILPGTTPHVQLRGVDLSRQVLGAVTLRQANLSFSRLANSDMRSVLTLAGADLHGADLTGADMDGLVLSGSNLRDANLTDARLEGVDLQRSDLRSARLIRATIESGHLEGAKLSGATLEGAKLKGASLAGAGLEGANLAGAGLEGANLAGAELEGANLAGANVERASLVGADLKHTDLQGATPLTAEAVHAARNWILAAYDAQGLATMKLPREHNDRVRAKDLSGYRLRGANLRGSDLRSFNLFGADLGEADLSDATLQNAKLQGAALVGADLTRADLRGADFYRARLRDAVLNGANLRGAQLHRVDGLTIATLHAAHEWLLANYDSGGLALLGLPRDHSVRLARKDLSDYQLPDAVLDRFDLSAFRLVGANFQRASLRGVNLQDTDLSFANLFAADLSGADLRRANLEGTNLDEALNLAEAQLADACGDEATRLPSYLSGYALERCHDDRR